MLGCSDSGFSKNEDPAESSDSSSASDSSETENPLYKDMELVRAGVVTLGTDDSSAPSSERPSMEVTLDYDFWMDKHEVTCGEFYKVMKEAGYKSIAKCDDDDLPRVNVTYYDAILYANARSALENLDSSYSYTKVNMNSEGNCTNLEGLEFIPGANGFRLPTESEWMLVASIGWDKEKSWNSKNSKNKLHPVCSATDDDAKFCDFEGNALEWVNDWMVAYKDTSLTNFAGGNFPNELAERVLKGGAYLRSPEEIRITGRTDVYTVTSQTMAEYVGFRLAQGKIENPVYLDQSGRAATSPVVILASSSTLNNVIKTRKAKLVFRNDVTGNLSYIDYNSSPLQVVEIQDSLTVYHPDVSPDGNWVAFCTLIEGVSGNSSVYVRSLDSAGNGLVKLDVEAAAIPRWRVLDGDTGIVYVTDAGNNSDDALWKKQGTWFVGFSNGKFGKSRKLLDGAYHGGYDEKSGMAVSGSKLLRVHGDDDEIWYNGEQACNVSLSQDGTLRTAFLDFSGKTGIEFVGTKYRVHERLLVANQNDSLIFSLASPKG
ncbi:MAG: TIGR02171 family protein, partial [Fibrobacter sp.]|nr:TIGR02171 family protein [Fibrobacter sp.]